MNNIFWVVSCCFFFNHRSKPFTFLELNGLTNQFPHFFWFLCLAFWISCLQNISTESKFRIIYQQWIPQPVCLFFEEKIFYFLNGNSDMQTECKLLSCSEKMKRKPLKTVLIETDTSFLVTWKECFGQDIFVPNINIVDESNIYDA